MNFVEVNGTALRYEMFGGGASTLVLIHEMGGTLESWDFVTPQFSAKRNVLRYDTRGAGLSQKVRGALTIDTMADDLVSLMDALGIAGKVALAGVAVGGAIAMHTAVRYPQRVAAVIASSPAIGVAPDRRPALLARVEKMEREGLHAVLDTLDNGYPPELRGDTQRFAAFRARWLGSDPTSYRRYLPDADRHGLAARAVAYRLSGPGDGRRSRSHASAASGRACCAGDSRRALRRARDGALRASANARALRSDDRRVS